MWGKHRASSRRSHPNTKSKPETTITEICTTSINRSGDCPGLKPPITIQSEIKLIRIVANPSQNLHGTWPSEASSIGSHFSSHRFGDMTSNDSPLPRHKNQGLQHDHICVSPGYRLQQIPICYEKLESSTTCGRTDQQTQLPAQLPDDSSRMSSQMQPTVP